MAGRIAAGRGLAITYKMQVQQPTKTFCNFMQKRLAKNISDMYKRPDGSSYTTAIKGCGVKKFKSSTAFRITVTGERDYNFIKHALSLDMYDEVLKGKQFTEYGIGYYSTSDGGLQVWVMIPISK